MREVEKILPKFVRKHLWREKHKEPNEKSTRQVASSSQTNKQTNKQTNRQTETQACFPVRQCGSLLINSIVVWSSIKTIIIKVPAMGN